MLANNCIYMKNTILLMCLLITSVLYAQEYPLSVKLPQGHPRYLTNSNGKAETEEVDKERTVGTGSV